VTFVFCFMEARSLIGWAKFIEAWDGRTARLALERGTHYGTFIFFILLYYLRVV